MSKSKVKLDWDGEMIRQNITVEDVSISAKDLIDSLEHARNEMDKIIGQEKQMKNNLVKISEDKQSINGFILDRKKFEDKCLEICKKKLVELVAMITPELVGKADVEAQAIINKDPEAYTNQQRLNQKYVIFQKMIATHKEIAQNAPAKLIRELIFENPIFENPLKD